MMTDKQFIEENTFNWQLFYFLVKHQEYFWYGYVSQTMEFITEAYRICGGIIHSQSPVTQIHTYIEYVEKNNDQKLSSLILAIVWAALSVHKAKGHPFKAVTNILYTELSSYNCFPLWKHFVSAYLERNGQVKISFPKDPMVMISHAENTEEAMMQALQSVKAFRSVSSGDIHQTLVFPHVEQFNNNPAKVINYNRKK